MYYVGIDGGASYSKLIGVDSDFKVVGRHMGNAVNFSKLPQGSALENLSKIMAEFSKLTRCKAEDCAGVCIGVSGMQGPEFSDGSPPAEESFREALRKAGFDCPVKIVSTAEITLAAKTKGGPGVLVSAHTDSFAFAIDDNGNMFRCGGLGHIVDGGGSGYAIGMQAIKYAFMSFDGRIPHSVLEDKVCEHFAVEKIEDALPRLRSGSFSKTKISELALVVKYAAENGDPSACLIQETAAKELYLLARALLGKCEIEVPTVVLSGPLLILNDAVRNTFTNLLKKDFPDIAVDTVKEKPEMGAIHLAMKDAAI